MKWINDTGKASKIFETFLVLLLILMIGATGLMMLHVQEQLKENTAASVKTVFDKSANLINSDILSAQNAVYRYSRYINWEDQEKSVAMLGAFLKEYGCHQAFYLDSDGTGYDASGNRFTVDDLPFPDFVLSKGEQGFSPFFLDKEGTCLTAMGIPVMKDGIRTGAFYAVYPMEKFSSNTLAKSIRGEGYYYLLDRQTDIMISAAFNTNDTGVGLTTLTNLTGVTGLTPPDISSRILAPMDAGGGFPAGNQPERRSLLHLFPSCKRKSLLVSLRPHAFFGHKKRVQQYAGSHRKHHRNACCIMCPCRSVLSVLFPAKTGCGKERAKRKGISECHI